MRRYGDRPEAAIAEWVAKAVYKKLERLAHNGHAGAALALLSHPLNPKYIAALTEATSDSSDPAQAFVNATHALGKLDHSNSVLPSLQGGGVNSRLLGLGAKKIIDNSQALFAFLLIGQVLEEEGTHSIPLVHLATRLDGQVEKNSPNTLSKNLRDIETLFRELNNDPRPQERDRDVDWEKFYVDEYKDYFDRRTGRPFRMLRKGKAAWQDVRDYFRNFPQPGSETMRRARTRIALDTPLIIDKNDRTSMKETS